VLTKDGEHVRVPGSTSACMTVIRAREHLEIARQVHGLLLGGSPSDGDADASL